MGRRRGLPRLRSPQPLRPGEGGTPGVGVREVLEQLRDELLRPLDRWLEDQWFDLPLKYEVWLRPHVPIQRGNSGRLVVESGSVYPSHWIHSTAVSTSVTP